MSTDTVIETVRAWAEDWCGVAPSDQSLDALREMLRLTAEAEANG